jgi:hypothetical protein
MVTPNYNNTSRNASSALSYVADRVDIPMILTCAQPHGIGCNRGDQ